jgi:hypothetical protein
VNSTEFYRKYFWVPGNSKNLSSLHPHIKKAICELHKIREKDNLRALAKRNNLDPKKDITELCTVSTQQNGD